MEIVKVLFFLSIILIFYTYIGYMAFLFVLLPFKKRCHLKKEFTPKVTFIITAYNEEKRIREKLESTLALEYPKEHIEILVASDGSTDRTDEIILSFERYGVKLIRSPERKGKEFAQKLAIDKAKGEILIFSDTATILMKNAIREITKNFADPSIGCVSSVDKLITKNGSISGENLYVRYEMALRRLESQINSLVGVSGSFFAVRKELCFNWPYDLASDFNVVLNTVRARKRAILDESVVGLYKDVIKETEEFNRKVRTILRGITVLFKNLDMLNFFEYGLFSWQLISHKLLRWLLPFFFIIAFVSNLFLIEQKEFLLIFIIQCLMYISIGVFVILPKPEKIKKIAKYFLIINLATIVAWWKFLKGEKITKWQPSRR